MSNCSTQADTDTKNVDGVLFVNNFSVFPQVEAPVQTLNNRSIEDYAMFTARLCDILSQPSEKRPSVGFVDNRFSNGADIWFAKYIFNFALNTTACHLNVSQLAYAGWNTDGTVSLPALALACISAAVAYTTHHIRPCR